ncbi:hypothetical protein [Psychroflexus sediminis]|uniref:Lipocalin-like domain-containing protein n=1 Tax=Psychroflexus sediminis TaxID=470826 RepID=A0A1G7ZGY7_9FLAO|nr:hypothetical protein [Psychroflexus sediminis]SDH08051.1 hypothetical protein SAMN04488027_1263 [Psychroflexus sediminis]
MNIFRIEHIFFLFVAIFFVNCNPKTNKKAERRLTDQSIEKNQKIDYSNYKDLIEGIWAENDSVNATFWLKNDSVYNVEHQDEPVHYYLLNDTLNIVYSESFTVKWVIVRLDKDSLYMTNDVIEDTAKLYRR